MIKTCNKCGKEFLTEADPYVVIPGTDGLNCGCYFEAKRWRSRTLEAMRIKVLSQRMSPEVLDSYIVAESARRALTDRLINSMLGIDENEPIG
jgi:hypothetical protein